MTHDSYATHVQAFLAEMDAVTKAKNADYSAGTKDAMDHYHSGAEEAGVTPVQVWFIMLMKHYQAIRRYVREGRLDSEPIHGRMIDMANYAMLGDALVNDLTNREIIKGKETK